MFCGHIWSLLLLTIIHGVCSSGTFEATCSRGNCQCGESVTITCSLTHKLVKIHVKDKENENETRFGSDLITMEKLVFQDGKISIEWTNVKLMTVTISNVSFSDIHRYEMYLHADAGLKPQILDFKVSGICDPQISENRERNELVCEVESEKNSSIIWRNNHRHTYKSPTESKMLTQVYKLWSSLKLSEEMEDNIICCAVSDGVNKEKEACYPITLAIASQRKISIPSAFAVFVPIVVLFAAVFYLMKRRNRIIIREGPGAENPTKPPLLPTETV